MTTVISVRFRSGTKNYYFDPKDLVIAPGQDVIVETAQGVEIAQCVEGNHDVRDEAVVKPLRQVVRIATDNDHRTAEYNRKREEEAFAVCQKKIVQHGLDMKLVRVECSFDGSKILFFFTADGRVDFRDLVKDLAGVFRSRIELRQIGVRDEAKMVGGIAICGRPYCCGQFLEDFQPVSTKMAKIQSLSLNPTKISGSCGRLMCCLRYEQEAYEELIKKVPKQGAFVETKDGYGTAVQVNLLRQCVKVRLDGDNDDTLHLYKSNELAAVPGGRPRDGEEPPHVLHYVPEPEEPEEKEDEWSLPVLYADDTAAQQPAPAAEEGAEGEKKRSHRRRSRSKAKPVPEVKPAEKAQPRQEPKAKSADKGEKADKPHGLKPAQKKNKDDRSARSEEKKPETAEKADNGQSRGGSRRHGKSTVKPVKLEPKPQADEEAKPKKQGGSRRRRRGGQHKSGSTEA